MVTVKQIEITLLLFIDINIIDFFIQTFILLLSGFIPQKIYNPLKDIEHNETNLDSRERWYV